MGQRDDLLAAVRARLDRVAATEDATALLDPTALEEAQSLARYGAGGETDLDAAYALGWFHYCRALALPPAEAEEEVRKAVDFFAPCFIAGADDIPLPLLHFVVSQAVLDEFGGALHPDTDPDHLTQAVSLWRRIIGIAPDSDPAKPAYLSNLGFALRLRFQQTGEPEDLEEAIAVGLAAFEAIPEDSPDRAVCLMNLGIALQLHDARAGGTPDSDGLMEATRQLQALRHMQSERALADDDTANLHEMGEDALAALLAVADEYPELDVPTSNAKRALLEQILQSGSLAHPEAAADNIRALLQIGASPAPGPPPAYAGRYRLEGRLGFWDLGIVHLARSASGLQLAVKIVTSDYAGDSDFRRRFRQEITAARRVSGDHIAPIVEADTEAEHPWLATPFIPGPDLAEHVQQNGPMSPAQLRQLMTGLAEALRDIHRAGVVHRDLKPSNVLLAEDGWKVLDFGLSRPADSELLTATGSLAGTAAFMAPEQFRDPRQVGPAADIFALGSVMVHAATGRGPFDSDSPYVAAYQIVHDEPDLLGVPESLAPLIMRCLAKSAEDRPTPHELMRELAVPLPERAPPRCQVHLPLLDDDPRVGTPARLAVELVADSEHPWARPGERPSLDIVAIPLSSAEVIPATALYEPATSTAAQFRVTAGEAGTHRIRLTFLHHETGLALQQVETDLDITEPEPTRARPLRPRTGRS